MRRLSSFLFAYALLFASVTPASAQVAVGISGGNFATAQNCQACTLNMGNATTGTLVTARGGTGLAGFGAAGAVLISTSSSVLSALAAGTNGYFFQMVAGLPAWSQTLAAVYGGTGLNSFTAGGVFFGATTTTVGVTSTNTDGYVLQAHGTSAPTFVNPSTIGTGAIVLAGQTLPATPVVGQVMYVSGDNTLTRGIATSCAAAQVVGAYQGVAAQIQVDGPQLLFFDSGLTLAAGNNVYVSDANAGQVTNVAPSASGHCVALVGRLATAAGYVSMSGSALNVVWQQPSLIQQL